MISTHAAVLILVFKREVAQTQQSSTQMCVISTQYINFNSGSHSPRTIYVGYIYQSQHIYHTECIIISPNHCIFPVQHPSSRSLQDAALSYECIQNAVLFSPILQSSDYKLMKSQLLARIRVFPFHAVFTSRSIVDFAVMVQQKRFTSTVLQLGISRQVTA